jgi:hypothetical protein
LSKSVELTAPEQAADLNRARAVLEAAVARGASVKLGPNRTLAGRLSDLFELDGPEERALATIASTGTSLVGSAALADTFDFNQLHSDVKSVTVLHPEVHGFIQKLPALGISAAMALSGRRVSDEENARLARAAWTTHASEFDVGKAAAALGTSAMQMLVLMNPMILGDLFVAPIPKIAAAARDWFSADTEDEETAAVTELQKVGTDWTNTLMSFTAFKTPIGMTQSVYSDAKAGRLDVAVGSAPVMLGLAYLTFKANVAAAKHLWAKAMGAAIPAVATVAGAREAIPAASAAAGAGEALSLFGRLKSFLGVQGLLAIPDLAEQGVSAAKGYLGAVDAAKEWADLGVAEATYYKIDPAKYELPFFGFDPSNDRGVLEVAGGRFTPRHAYVLGNERTSSTLTDRLRQLAGRPDASVAELLRRPQDFAPENVWRFVEKPFPTWEFLKRLSKLKATHPELATAKAAANFQFEPWRSKVEELAANSISSAQPGSGRTTYALDEAALEKLYRANDVYGPLSVEQQRHIEDRLRSSVETTRRWLETLNRMSLPDRERRAAIVQFIGNLAANHRSNSILFEALGHRPELRTQNLTHLLSRESTPDDFFVAVTNYLP